MNERAHNRARAGADRAGATDMNTAVQEEAAIERYEQRSQCAVTSLPKRFAARMPTLLPAIVLAIAAFLAVAPRLAVAAEATVNVAKFVTPAEMRAGSLLLKSEGDRFVEAPLVGTDIDLVVSGPTARARVTQIFHNPTDGWVEAVYVYPLPEGCAVDTLKMVIGERIVVADIMERSKAREVYEQ